MSRIANEESTLINKVLNDNVNIQKKERGLKLINGKNTVFEIFPANFKKRKVIVLNFKIKEGNRWLSGELIFSFKEFTSILGKYKDSKNFSDISDFINKVAEIEIKDIFLPPF